jgi:radical SAM protein with 4Fe4S-binding SPASM domain
MTTIIMKATERCNSACSYCSVMKTRKGVSIGRETLTLLFQNIDCYLKDNSDERLELLWHGGEPLVLGYRFFDLVYELQYTHCASTAMRIEHRIQSNLTALKLPILESLRKLGVQEIGCSYDPLPGVRGKGGLLQRRRHRQHFLSGISLLSRYAIHWGLIFVVTKDALHDPVRLFHHLVNLGSSVSISFMPVLPGEQTAHLEITPKEFTTFLQTVFDVWYPNRHRYPDVEPFITEDENQNVYHDTHTVTSSYKDLAQKIVCTPDGKILPSHIPLGSEERSYGMLMTDSFDEIMNRAVSDFNIHVAEMHSSEPCTDCQFWDHCYAGKMLDAFNQNSIPEIDTAWCEARAQHHDYMRLKLDKSEGVFHA